MSLPESTPLWLSDTEAARMVLDLALKLKLDRFSPAVQAVKVEAVLRARNGITTAAVTDYATGALARLKEASA